MTACACPDLVLAPRETIPSEPLQCGCCGKPLVLTCAGECGTKHVRAAFRNAAKKPMLERLPRGQVKPHECGRCHRVIPTKHGRPPKFCEDCLTPAELKRRTEKNAYNESRRRPNAQQDGG